MRSNLQNSILRSHNSSRLKIHKPTTALPQYRPRTLQKQQHYRCNASLGLPGTAAEVVTWAQQQFLQEIGKSDESISLAKVCLIIALEEEAVAHLESAKQSHRTSATASTWSLTRLDALAAEVMDNLMAQNPQLAIKQEDTVSSPAASTAAPSDSPTYSDQVSAITQQAGMTAPTVSSAVPFKANQSVQEFAQLFPMQVLTAVNNVLFGRHGYAACNRYGTATDSHLSNVLETGPGSCAALTVLYLEVCSRLGLQLDFKVLEEGRYCLVWPRAKEQQQQQQQLLVAAGEACVVDVYGKGALLPVKEVTDLFDISEEDLFAGSSKRSLLAALLAEQQHAHWCKAIGCSPQPAFMTQLSAATAVGGKVKQLNGLSIERATAAARKRVTLLPGDLAVQLQLALLCYFSGRYEDAWLELGSYLEGIRRLQAASGVSDVTYSNKIYDRPDGPDPVSAATAAAASLTGALEIPAAVAAAVSAAATMTAESDDSNEEESSDVLLLFEKLQLELVIASTGEPNVQHS